MNPAICAGCIHFLRDEVNHAAGMGECMNEPSRHSKYTKENQRRG